MLRIYLWLLLNFSFSFLFGQVPRSSEDYAGREYPAIGKRCPSFILQNIRYYPKQKSSLEDFKGKWLILDFWNKSCSACIASFPHINELQKELADKVQVMMVGIEDSKREIEFLYKKFREHENLLMPCAFDSAIAQRFDIYTAPYIIIIDPDGIVRATTGSIHSDEMKSFLNGKTPELSYARRVHEEDAPTKDMTIPYDDKKPLGINNNGVADSSFLFRSSLYEWNITQRWNLSNISDHLKQGRFDVMGVTLEGLYHYAYIGVFFWSAFDSALYEEYYPKIILEVKDSSLFKPSYKPDDCRNIFSYSVSMPPGICSKERIQENMQRDLANYFGYKVTLETRKCAIWKLVASDEVRLKLATKVKRDEMEIEGNVKVGYKAKNVLFKNVFNLIKVYNPGIIFEDSTGITGKVDINMNCDGCVLVNSVESIKKALRKNGIDLLAEEKEMKVIVVRDK